MSEFSVQLPSRRWPRALAFIAAVLLLCVWLTHRVHIYGEVVDDKTGKPVADAIVIASFWNSLLGHIWDTWPERYQVQTGADGRFSFDGYTPFVIGWVNVEASSGDDKYAFAASGNKWLAPFAGHFRLTVKPINDPNNQWPNLHHKTFIGNWSAKPDRSALAHVRVPYED